MIIRGGGGGETMIVESDKWMLPKRICEQVREVYGGGGKKKRIEEEQETAGEMPLLYINCMNKCQRARQTEVVENKWSFVIRDKKNNRARHG
jgi:hypothetical protein